MNLKNLFLDQGSVDDLKFIFEKYSVEIISMKFGFVLSATSESFDGVSIFLIFFSFFFTRCALGALAHYSVHTSRRSSEFGVLMKKEKKTVHLKSGMYGVD